MFSLLVPELPDLPGRYRIPEYPSDDLFNFVQPHTLMTFRHLCHAKMKEGSAAYSPQATWESDELDFTGPYSKFHVRF